MGRGAFKDLSSQEYQRLTDVAKYGLDEAARINNIGVDELRILLDSRGLPSEQAALQVELNDFITNASPATKIALGVAEGSNPFFQSAADIANRYTNFALSGSAPGMTNPLQQVQDRAFDITNTQGTAGLDELVDSQRTLGDIISTGGMTGPLNELFGIGKALVRQGGFTPELQSFMKQGLAAIAQFASGTPEMKQAFAAAKKIVDAGGEGGSLIPIDQMISFARDEAASASQSAFDAMRRREAQTRDVTGATVGGVGPYAEFADQISQNQAKAVRDASLGAQDLRLRRETAGLGLMGDVSGQFAQLAAAGAGATGSLYNGGLSYAGNALRGGLDAMGSASSIAAQNLGTATSGMVGIGNIFANREQNAFSNLLGVNDAANRNTSMAFDMNSKLYGGNLEGANSLGNMNLNAANQYGNNMNSAADRYLRGIQTIPSFADPYFNIYDRSQQGFQNVYSTQAPIIAAPNMWQQFGFNLLNAAGAGAINAFTGGFDPGSIADILNLGGGGSRENSLTSRTLGNYAMRGVSAPNVNFYTPTFYPGF